MPLHFDVTKLRGVNITGDMKIDGNEVETAVLLGVGEVLDLNGNADALVLDADGDTSISAPTDDQIDFELKSVDHVVMKAVAVADSGAITNIVEIAATSPVDTTGTNTHNALNIDLEIGNASGGTNAVRAIAIDNITGDAQVTATGILLGTGYDIGLDMQGTKLELDADNDTSIIASTDDQIDIEIAGAIDFTLTVNTLTAVSGSTIATNTIAETTADNGVAIDGLTIKDGTVRDGTATSASFVIGAETGGHEITVNIQLLDAGGADMAIRSSVGFYLSNDANGDSTKVAATSLVGGTDGIMQEFISNSAGRLVSEADGDIDIVIGDASGVATYYLILVMPNGKLVASTAITFA